MRFQLHVWTQQMNVPISVHHLLLLCQDPPYSRKYEVEQLWRWCDSAPGKQMKRTIMASPDQDCSNWDIETGGGTT